MGTPRQPGCKICGRPRSAVPSHYHLRLCLTHARAYNRTYVTPYADRSEAAKAVNRAAHRTYYRANRDEYCRKVVAYNKAHPKQVQAWAQNAYLKRKQRAVTPPPG